MLRLSFLLLGLLLAATAVSAETGYVTDQLVLTLRSAPTAEYEILDHLKTDTRVEILGEEGKFLRVRTTDGKEGYVLRQYITDRTPKKFTIQKQAQQIEQLKRQLAAASDDNSQMREQLAALQSANARLQEELAQHKARFDKTSRQYQKLLEASRNLLELTQERDRLREENGHLATEVERLKEENASLLTTGSIKWFLAGAGVLFFGWILGKLSRRKRRPF
ncbi:SH3 domain protein [Geothermobacter ehrlichii]|uniref:SH3 domain protein n=1 Tax=Geothermobacter ehrlichii TaxID=213224 RepID=A0A5D3WMA0_9BACT|nr:TIGR04211 family SH3 domain-containing protein [Geothermobacter ehrlichii]TYO99323.1 SH3 domain protein [Geothermobacter ehrlichii]